jgi:hypothetical protein
MQLADELHLPSLYLTLVSISIIVRLTGGMRLFTTCTYAHCMIPPLTHAHFHTASATGTTQEGIDPKRFFWLPSGTCIDP